jgi:nicotinate-nucleotide adenylyltransferase
MKVGLFLGSFNPIHMGHLIIANYLIEYSDLEKIWFVVSPQNPFKQIEDLLTNQHRYEMAQLAIGNDARFSICNVEFDMPVPSYTVDTLSKLAGLYPEIDFSLIIGADNFLYFGKWKEAAKIACEHSIFVYPRKGFAIDMAGIDQNFTFIDAPLVELSSTFIRNAIFESKDVRYMLPHGVYDYILSKGLYI